MDREDTQGTQGRRGYGDEESLQHTLFKSAMISNTLNVNLKYTSLKNKEN